jgi:hypothetical protein
VLNAVPLERLLEDPVRASRRRLSMCRCRRPRAAVEVEALVSISKADVEFEVDDG